jgi:hypothetical protein
MKKLFFRLLVLSFIMVISLKIIHAQNDTKPDRERMRSFAPPDTTKVMLLGAKVDTFLNLSADQKAKIHPIIDTIKNLQTAQMKKMQEFRAKREAGEEMDRDEMMKMREQREKEVTYIKGLIENIKKELTKEQLEKFKDVQLPMLEMRRGGQRPPRD